MVLELEWQEVITPSHHAAALLDYLTEWSLPHITNKLHGLWSTNKLYRLSDRRFLAIVSANFCR
jgi:hypothetical protein